MNLFDSIEKLISEHGSASILRDHVALLKSQMSEKDVKVNELYILLKQKDAKIHELQILLEQKNIQITNFQKIIDSTTMPDDICPYCKKPKLKLLEIKPHEFIPPEMGVKVYYYQCENCGKKYNREKQDKL